ncbi:uncharacterized protein LOC123878980 [Maniola jurtina]|uniref:uncharacterized protein LOC123878980 n=1 Tax=Maniola jurtina TaxID=191418 RepID=UPI001E68B88F|nr:uncharacterized protein LOC123878980 [Maniola jurtina]
MQFLQRYFTFCVALHTVIVQTGSNMLMTPINNNQVEEYQISAMSCIVNLTKKFIPCGALMTLVDTTNQIDPLIKSLSVSDCYTFILRSIHRHWRMLPTEAYIISSSNVDQLRSSLNELTKEVGWNPRATVFLTIHELEKEEITEIFELLLTHNVFDVLFIKEDKNGVSKVYNYFPYDNQKCGQVTDDIIKEEDCNYVETIEKNSKTLESKYQNCTIVVAASEDLVNFIFKTNSEFSYLGRKIEGIEQRLLKNIAKLENLSIKYILLGTDMQYGIVLPNHTITGVLSYLQNNTVSIAGGGFFLIWNRVELFDFIWGYNFANLYLFTPVFGEENWKKVFQEFSGTTWMLIVLSFFFTTTVVTVVRKCLLHKEDDKLLIVIKMWGYIYGRPDLGLFQVKKMRIIIIIWILFTYFISSFYNTAYYSLLTRKHDPILREGPVNLQSLPYLPCLTDVTRIFFKYNFNETLPGKENENCRDPKIALDLVANSGKYYAIDMDYGYKLREYRYLDEDGNPKLQKSKYTSDMPVTLYTNRGFPLLRKFQRYAAYHFESGIFQKHLEEIYHSNKIFHKHHKSKYRNSRLSDYKVEFYILYLGYFISSVCFIIEINK